MLEPLLLDLLEWVGKETRSYAEVMEAWRTSCPRLPVWEEAIDRGFLQRMAADGGAQVVLSEAGRGFLGDNGRMQGARGTDPNAPSSQACHMPPACAGC
jgi:D-3-phosphoglycerate dehydrogenase / 2-oxoglutarate reductase